MADTMHISQRKNKQKACATYTVEDGEGVVWAEEVWFS